MSPEMLIAALSPLGVALVRKISEFFNQKVPKVALPILAPLVGLVVNFAMGQLGFDAVTMTAAIGAGLAGVGIREIADQGRKAIPGS